VQIVAQLSIGILIESGLFVGLDCEWACGEEMKPVGSFDFCFRCNQWELNGWDAVVFFFFSLLLGSSAGEEKGKEKKKKVGHM